MTHFTTPLATHARELVDVAIAAADPERQLLAQSLPVADAKRILVVGGGKAGGRMAIGLERLLANQLDRVQGIVNVPQGTPERPQRIRLHAARPAGSNHPTAEGVVGSDAMLNLLASAGPNDLAIGLMSGGGSALLPAPIESITLDDKQHITKLLHGCGATIHEMNAVRKHLSRIKGGRLAEAFRGRAFINLIISDVVGDPLDVIASGPTAPDPTTYADALEIIDKYDLRSRTPDRVLAHLDAGRRGLIAETPKVLPSHVENRIIASNANSIHAMKRAAESWGYRVLNLGSMIEGETREVATVIAGIVRSIRVSGEPIAAPACLLLGGETTVTLGTSTGKGGRNQEFVLAMLEKLGERGMEGVCVLSAGTDGEDGPTDAAGAIATLETLQAAGSPKAALANHDAYSYFERVGALIRSGLTGTNVMDVRAVLMR